MTRAELDLLLQEGEGYSLEFRENAAGGLAKDIVAFANASGGRVIIGVDAGRILHPLANPDDERSRVQDVAGRCDPPVKVKVEELDGLLIVAVPEGDDKPYRCSDGFFLRVGPNSQKLTRDQIVEFVKSEGKARFDEMTTERFDFDASFDPAKLANYLDRAGISATLGTEMTLVNLGVAVLEEGRARLNNAGVLLFARNLADVYFHTAVTCVLYKGTEKVDVLDRKDFNSDLLDSVENAMVFLKQHLRTAYRFTGAARRQEVPEVPFEALREAVVNAVVHRDYFERGANVVVEVFDDRVEISNPGGLPKGLRPDEFGTRSVQRNPLLADLFHRAHYIERLGTGISRIRDQMARAGLPPVKFTFTGFFTAVFTRPKLKTTKDLGEPTADSFRINFSEKFRIRAKRAARLADTMSLASAGPLPHVANLARRFRVTTRVIYDDFRFLREQGLLKLEGSRKTGSYNLTDEGRRLVEELSK